MQRAACRRWVWSLLAALSVCSAPAVAQNALPLLDVPFISQSELLCGGAAAAMVLRYWGERGIDAETFEPLVDRRAGGIRTTALADDLRRRGWMVTVVDGTIDIVASELAAGRPALTLIEDRPHAFHFIVVVGIQARTIVFHDPARAPFRVMSRDEFSRRWAAASRWMAIVTPGAVRTTDDVRPPVTLPQTACEQLVAGGVARAQANDLPGAERALRDALSCPGAVALRELAGVRALQRRWPDAATLASAAAAIDPNDTYTWRLLGTAEFVQDNTLAALEAWNRAAEPRVDLIRVDGLQRTRFRVVEQLIDIRTRDLLTAPMLRRGRRQLSELPAALTTQLTYAPVGSGLVEVRGAVVERALLPHDVWSVAALGVSAASSRSVTIRTGSITGGGESAVIAWRFWERRPRVAGSFSAPAPFGGTWSIDGFAERQPFDRAPASQRAGMRLTTARWIAAAARIAVRGGIDRWRDAAAQPVIGVDLRLVSPEGRADVHVAADSWLTGSRFTSATVAALLQSSPRRAGLRLEARGGASLITAAAPLDLWPAGDTGVVRPLLLRAHPLVSDGAFRVDQLGRRIVFASAEVQRWWSRDWSILQMGVAGFADAARTMRRLDRGDRGDADVGIGARFAVGALPGVLHINYGHGLADGRSAVSFVYVVE